MSAPPQPKPAPFPAFPLPGASPTSQNAPKRKETAKERGWLARRAAQMRAAAARYRAKPGIRQREAARLRAWRAGRRAFLSATTTTNNINE